MKMLFYQDSNLDKQDQNLLCYHYTIEQFHALQEQLFVCGCKGRHFYKTGKLFLPFFIRKIVISSLL